MDYPGQKEMSQQLVKSPETVTTGPPVSAGMVRNSPDSQPPPNSPSQGPTQLAQLATALSGDNQALPAPEEAKPDASERTNVGVCQVAPAQACASSGKEATEAPPPKNAPKAPARAAPCKIPPLQSTDAAAHLGQNDIVKGAWANLSPSTVVLGADGIPSVLPGSGSVTEVSQIGSTTYLKVA